jgi:hypothetical protein
MSFKKIFAIWLVISLLSGIAFFLVKTLLNDHPLWPWAIPFIYIAVLILFALYVLTPKIG